MLLTLLGNRRRVIDAAKVAKARQEGIHTGRQEGRQEGLEIGRLEGREIGRREARQQIRQEMADWYQSIKEDLAAGRDPGPPPTFDETGNQPS